MGNRGERSASTWMDEARFRMAGGGPRNRFHSAHSVLLDASAPARRSRRDRASRKKLEIASAFPIRSALRAARLPELDCLKTVIRQRLKPEVQHVHKTVVKVSTTRRLELGLVTRILLSETDSKPARRNSASCRVNKRWLNKVLLVAWCEGVVQACVGQDGQPCSNSPRKGRNEW